MQHGAERPFFKPPLEAALEDFDRTLDRPKLAVREPLELGIEARGSKMGRGRARLALPQ